MGGAVESPASVTDTPAVRLRSYVLRIEARAR